MTSIDSVTIEADDPETAAAFYSSAFDLGTRLRVRRALAQDAGVAADGSGSHRLVIGSDAGAFTDPDGFSWQPS
jgi:predicted enzyme related to lactoylglutathione lyase